MSKTTTLCAGWSRLTSPLLSVTVIGPLAGAVVSVEAAALSVSVWPADVPARLLSEPEGAAVLLGEAVVPAVVPAAVVAAVVAGVAALLQADKARAARTAKAWLSVLFIFNPPIRCIYLSHQCP
ncbi:MAG: hypothetical protein PHR21_01825 [Oscillospiraceae bacterium]|nr:hypothetical protein [Oscillospiraceae bacterium]